MRYVYIPFPDIPVLGQILSVIVPMFVFPRFYGLIWDFVSGVFMSLFGGGE